MVNLQAFHLHCINPSRANTVILPSKYSAVFVDVNLKSRYSEDSCGATRVKNHMTRTDLYVSVSDIIFMFIVLALQSGGNELSGT